MRDIQIDELIDPRPLGTLQWPVIGFCSLVALLDDFDVQIIAHAGPVISAELDIPTLSWRPLFVIGGVVPLLPLVALMRYLPESARYLISRGPGHKEKLQQLLRRMRLNGELPADSL